MSKPWKHAESSARKWGGKPEDYFPIHNFMDSTKSGLPDNRHRAVLHNSWAIGPDGPLEKVFGPNITVTLDDGKTRLVSVRDIGEQHILEDFGGKFIPTLDDYLVNMEYREWMNGKGTPPSHQKIADRRVTRKIDLD